jgi:hypothetical protein
MLCRTLLLLCLASIASAVATAQARGRVLGFDGQPVAGVMLNLLDAKDEYIADVESRADGSYRFGDEPRGATVRAWLEGVVLSHRVDGGRADFDFKVSKYFTVRGSAVDPEGKAIAALEIFCSAANDDWLATATTDARGVFAVRLNQPVDHLLVDPAGWRHRVAGPFTTDAGVAIDLRLAKEFFRLAGTLRDESGAAVQHVRVIAMDDKENVAVAHTGAGGHWAAWCNRPVTRLWFDAGDTQHVHAGQWSKAATVDLDWRGLGFVVLTGRVLDADGRPVAGCRLIPLEDRSVERHLPEPIATTGADGRFRALAPPWARFVVAHVGEQPVFATGPWTKDTELTLRAAK